VIEAVASNVSIPLLAQLCRHARDVAGQASGLAICRAVQAASANADDALVGVLQECANDNDPDRNTDQTTVGEGTGDIDDLLVAGLNCTRGVAAQAIAAVIFSAPERANGLIPVMESLVKDQSLAVRTLAAQAVLVLMQTHADTALNMTAELFDAVGAEITSTQVRRHVGTRG
jgi:hypothetical protein